MTKASISQITIDDRQTIKVTVVAGILIPGPLDHVDISVTVDLDWHDYRLSELEDRALKKAERMLLLDSHSDAES